MAPSNTLNVKLNNAIISYPKLFEAEENLQGKLVYSAAFLVKEGSQEHKDLRAAAFAALREEWGDKAPQMFKDGELKITLRTDTKKKGYPDGYVFFTAATKYRPGVINRRKEEITAADQVTGGPNEIFAGCIVRATVRAFPYDQKGNKGASFQLNNVQLVTNENVTRLDGRASAEDDFEDELEETPASAADVQDFI